MGPFIIGPRCHVRRQRRQRTAAKAATEAVMKAAATEAATKKEANAGREGLVRRPDPAVTSAEAQYVSPHVGRRTA